MSLDEPEYGKIIPDFPNYEVTNYGRVFNTETGREMVRSPTGNGDLTVGMMLNGNQYRRAIKGLVAREFVAGETDSFDTPVILDGDKSNLYYKNICWRPRWFAWMYTHQFTHYEHWHHTGQIVNLTDGTVYNTFMEASIDQGILCSDIRESIYNETPVFPTGDRYDYVR